MLLKNEWVILIIMFVLHIFADFHLQGILANLKQKKWWKEELKKYNFDDEEKEYYKYDWIPALLAHSFEWSFFIMLPFLFVEIPVWVYVVLLIFNTGLHFGVDYAKCNAHALNLWGDQLFHIIQILFTWYILSEIIF